VEIVGVTSSFGNGTIETTTRNLLYLCQLFGIDAPVAEGAAQPLFGEAGPPVDHVHGTDGLGDIAIPEVPRAALHEKTADAFIVEMVHRFPHRITLIGVARMTNLALALRRDPSIAGLVRQVIVMGGAFGFHGHFGNKTPAAETNIHGDPLAADEVFGAAWPVTVVGLDVTQETIMAAEMIERIGQHGGPEGRFIRDIARFYLDFHRRTEGMDAMFTHDSSAVAYLIDPSLFTTRRGPIRVVTEGIAVGQTIQKPDGKAGTPPAWKGRPSHTICTGVDATRLLDLYYRTVTA
jgi:inosine-uridine nucleoside N-ribohydrolase